MRWECEKLNQNGNLVPHALTTRAAPAGLPKVSTFTILQTLHEAGYTWQKTRTWCHTGRTLKKGKDGTVYQSEDPYTPGKKR
jgi:hypothetical protein